MSDISKQYGSENETPKPIKLNEQFQFTNDKNVTVINFGDKQIVVPTLYHIRTMVGDIESNRKDIRKLETENNRLRGTINKLISDINLLKSKLDNKLDKL